MNEAPIQDLYEEWFKGVRMIDMMRQLCLILVIVSILCIVRPMDRRLRRRENAPLLRRGLLRARSLRELEKQLALKGAIPLTQATT